MVSFRLSAGCCAAAVCCFAAAWKQPAISLPAPYATPVVANGAKVIPRPEGAELHVPKGFKVEKMAEGFLRPRFMVQVPSGEILISDTVADGSVYKVKGGEKTAIIQHLDRPYGLAFWKEYLYVGEPTSIKRYRFDAKTVTVGPGEEVVALKGYDKGHVTRTIAFDPKGQKMYVTVGSSTNVVVGDPKDRAAINRYNPDGTGAEVFCSGLRNTVGLRFYPGTNHLWGTVEERDGLGDGLVPDFFAEMKQGAFYGWPYSYLGSHADPRIDQTGPGVKELVAKATVPDVILEAHVAVLDLLFYTGKQFPAEYRGGAFLANHGSSGRASRVGYSVSFVPFQKGRPAGAPRDFLTGWMLGPDKKEVWGRPVGLLQMADGSMLVSEDGGKAIWRVSYGK